MVEVIDSKEKAAAEVLQQRQVRDLVMQREDGLDVLPPSPPRRDASPAIGLGPVDEVIRGEDILGLKCTVDDSVLASAGMFLDDAVEPVLHTKVLLEGERAPGGKDEAYREEYTVFPKRLRGALTKTNKVSS